MTLRTSALAFALALVACSSDDDHPPAAGGDNSGCYPGLECRFVEVPQVHGAPGGATIGLKLIIGHPATPNPAARPIIYLEGGPGGTVKDAAESGFVQAVATVLGRDFILLEQRGNTLSRPALDCGADVSAAGVQACTAKYSAEGFRIETFNTVENAHDIEDVRIALGVPKVILWGGSYGGELAQTAARLHPDSIAGMLLESSAMTGRPYRPFEQERAQPIKLAAFLAWLKQACAANATCAAEMPALDPAAEVVLFESNVATTPFTVTPELVLDNPSIAHELLLLSMYYIPNAVLVLRMMYAVNHGHVDTFDKIRVGAEAAREYLARIVSFASVNRSAYLIYNCYDTVLNWTDPGLAEATAGLYNGAQRDGVDKSIASERQACGALPPASIPQSELAVSTVTNVPTIFFHGGLDWPTPLENVESDIGHFSRSQLVSVPCAGHGIQGAIPQCFTRIASTFFFQADAGSFDGTIDASCAATFCDSSPDEALFAEQ